MTAIGGTEGIFELFLGTEGAARAPDMINSRYHDSQTPLIISCRLGNTESARRLALTKPTDPSARDKSGKAKTPSIRLLQAVQTSLRS